MRLKGEASTQDPRLDRVVEFDEASRSYPIRALIAPSRKVRSYTWSVAAQLDQGQEGACVGFSIAHELAARPVVVDATETLARELYHRARQLDEWPGEADNGTSVLAGMKAATESGYFSEYRWAFGVDDLILALSYHGPAVLGIAWHEGMEEPDERGYIAPTGSVLGGHAILANAVSLKRKAVHLHNSWGADWNPSDKGGCWIFISDLDALLQNNGEACVPVKRSRPRN